MDGGCGMRCSGCGTEIQPGLTRCPTCGRPTELPPPPPPQAPPPPQPQYGQYPPQAQYPPYGAPAPAPSQGMSTLGKVILIIAVVVVVGIIVAVALIYVVFLGVVEEVTTPENEKVTVNLASPIMQQRDIDSTTYWDAALNVNKVTPRNVELQWSDVRLIARSSMGSVLIPPLPLDEDGTMAYDDASDGIVVVEVWFVDVDGDGLFEAGDTIKLTGMTTEYEGALVELHRSGELIASGTLPTDFP